MFSLFRTSERRTKISLWNIPISVGYEGILIRKQNDVQGLGVSENNVQMFEEKLIHAQYIYLLTLYKLEQIVRG